MSRRPLVAGNWKLNCNHLEAIGLVQKIAFSLTEQDAERAEVAVFPPFTALRSVQTLVEGDDLPIAYGAQDVSAHDSGAFTGEISGGMLTKLSCSYVLVSHSERREYHFEDDAMVNAKMQAATRNGLKPIMCVGESLEVRQSGGHVWFTLGQLEAGFAGIPADKAIDAVVAYEPIWAIGTGQTATPQDAQEQCSAIRDRLADMYSGDVADSVRILYGGSVKADNAADLAAQEDVDGALVGGASLDGAGFAEIVKAFAASAT